VRPGTKPFEGKDGKTYYGVAEYTACGVCMGLVEATPRGQKPAEASGAAHATAAHEAAVPEPCREPVAPVVAVGGTASRPSMVSHEAGTEAAGVWRETFGVVLSDADFTVEIVPSEEWTPPPPPVSPPVAPAPPASWVNHLSPPAPPALLRKLSIAAKFTQADLPVDDAAPTDKAARFRARKASITAGDCMFEGWKGTKERPGRCFHNDSSTRRESSGSTASTSSREELAHSLRANVPRATPQSQPMEIAPAMEQRMVIEHCHPFNMPSGAARDGPSGVARRERSIGRPSNVRPGTKPFEGKDGKTYYGVAEYTACGVCMGLVEATPRGQELAAAERARAREAALEAELRAQLATFAADGGAFELLLPRSLSAFERMLAHQLAEELRFGHASVGEADSRQLRVFKISADATDADAADTADAAVEAAAKAEAAKAKAKAEAKARAEEAKAEAAKAEAAKADADTRSSSSSPPTPTRLPSRTVSNRVHYSAMRWRRNSAENAVAHAMSCAARRAHSEAPVAAFDDAARVATSMMSATGGSAGASDDAVSGAGSSGAGSNGAGNSNRAGLPDRRFCQGRLFAKELRTPGTNDTSNSTAVRV